MDLTTVKSEVLLEAGKFRIGPRVLRLQKQTEGSAVKISKIKNVNGAVVPTLGTAPISLFDVDTVVVFPLTIKATILFPEECFEDNGLNEMLQKSINESFVLAEIENKIVVETLIAGAGKKINSENKPDVREKPILDNFISAIKFIEENKYHPDAILINPKIAETLRQRDELKDKLIAYAIEVIIDTSIPENTVIVLDSANAGLLIERVPLEISEHSDPWQSKKGFLLRERVAPIVLNGNAVAVIQ